MAKAGKFITIEGGEGVGKSTQVKLLKQYCIENNINAVFTREPGGTELAEKIRNIILDAKNVEMDSFTELLLYSASRRQHIKELIEPFLNAGKVVFCDRFYDSTIAYQGYARGQDIEKIRLLNNLVCGELKIDLTLFFDLDPKSGFLRKGGADKSDRLENESIDFHKRVYEGFKQIALSEPKRFVSIDAKKTIEQIHEDIINTLKAKGVI